MPAGRPRRARDIIVESEPTPMPEVQVKVLDANVIPRMESEAARILSEYSADPDTQKVIEELYKTYEKSFKLGEKVMYVTDSPGLNVIVDVLRFGGDGKPVFQQTVVEFRRGRFETDDPFLVKALEIHPSFGGMGDEYSTTSREPLFWRGSFPKWRYEMIAAREAELSPMPREE